jgi:hypothetical protein
MSDLLEDDLRDALADRAARITAESSARLRAVDYQPRGAWLSSRRRLSALGALGLSGAAAAAGAVILLGSSAAPAFAGWTRSPTAPLPGQHAAAQQRCSTGSSTPVLTDTRGPYTASIYADGSTCVDGNGIEISSTGDGGVTSSIPAAQWRRRVRLRRARPDDGRRPDRRRRDRRDDHTQRPKLGSGDRQKRLVPGLVARNRAGRDGPGGKRERDQHAFPPRPDRPAPPCPAGAHCASGYGFASGWVHRGGRSTVRIAGSNTGGQ